MVSEPLRTLIAKLEAAVGRRVLVQREPAIDPFLLTKFTAQGPHVWAYDEMGGALRLWDSDDVTIVPVLGSHDHSPGIEQMALIHDGLRQYESEFEPDNRCGCGHCAIEYEPPTGRANNGQPFDDFGTSQTPPQERLRPNPKPDRPVPGLEDW